MVSVHESRMVLAKSRRLLVTSKRLLQDLEYSLTPINAADASTEAPPKNPSDRCETRPAYAGVDDHVAPNQAEQRQHGAGSESWNRPRQPR